MSLLPFALMAILLLGAKQLVRFTASGDVRNQPASQGSLGVDPRLMKSFAAREWFMETFFRAALASAGPSPAAAAELHWSLVLRCLTMREFGLAETGITETLRLQPGQAYSARYFPVLRHRADQAAQP